MTITHQILTDAEGKPVAAQIPWEEFEMIKAELEGKPLLDEDTRALLDRRSQELEEGTVEGIGNEEMFRRVRKRVDEKRALKQNG